MVVIHNTVMQVQTVGYEFKQNANKNVILWHKQRGENGI